jgi:polysaccharide export outer membrane protein
LNILENNIMRKSINLSLVGLFLLVLMGFSWAQEKNPSADITIGSGDTIRIVVFQNPDLTIDTRVSESGAITYPLLGSVQVGGLTIDAAEKRIANGLREGGFVPQPQVNISLAQILGNRVTILGKVGKPGRIPIDTFNTKLSDILATAGGVATGGDGGGSDIIILIGTRDGKPFRKEIDFPAIFLDGKLSDDVVVAGGDVIYVHEGPMYYIYGEINSPGFRRIERGMTIQQALVKAGGPNPRGTESDPVLYRRDKDGQVIKSTADLFEPVKPHDVIYVRERLF